MLKSCETGVGVCCVSQAVVASEDHRFFYHQGYDVRGLARAVTTLGQGGGGSTITQQLVKNLLLSQSRTITRKVVEILMAVYLERRMGKPAIIEAYLNNVYWGHGVVGIAHASAAYFRKKPSQLDVGEAALLAGLLPAPEYLSPYKNATAAKRARNQVSQTWLGVMSIACVTSCIWHATKVAARWLLADGISLITQHQRTGWFALLALEHLTSQLILLSAFPLTR